MAAQDKDGMTPLHLASGGGHMDLARFLIEHGAKAEVQGEDGIVLLLMASFGGYADVARLLI